MRIFGILILWKRGEIDMFNNEKLVKLLENHIYIFRGDRIQKLQKAPRRLVFSKTLEQTALCFKKSFKCKAKTFYGEEMFIIIPEVVSLSI